MKRFFRVGFFILFFVFVSAFAVEAKADALEKTDAVEVYTVRSAIGGYEAWHSDDTDVSYRGDTLSEIVENISSDVDMAHIDFENITTSEKLSFKSGEYILSGSLEFKGSGGAVIEGAGVMMRNLTVKLEAGEIRLKSGSLFFESAFVDAEQVAIRIDYSASSVFEMRSGEISASSEEGALVLDCGTARIGGGKINNSSGAAIISASTLILFDSPEICGNVCDVFSTSPITLSDGESEFKGKLRLKFDRIFEKGRMSVVAYGANESSIDAVTLLDGFGREQKIKFYEESELASEKNFLTAYIPYEIRFADSEEGIQYRLLGEKVDIPSPTVKEGYEFLGWRREGDDSDFLEKNYTVTKDEAFYPSYRLIAPSFSIHSMEFVYCDEVKYLTLGGLSHPLLSEGVVTYKWYKDGEECSDSQDKIPIKNASDSGKYKCKFTFFHKSDSITVETPEVSVIVHKRLVGIPTVENTEYNGVVQNPRVYSTSVYTAEASGGIDAGIYPVSFRIIDSENYGFYPDGADFATVNFCIFKAKNEWVEAPRINNSYTWEMIKAVATAVYGESIFLFSTSADGEFTDAIPSEAGIYYAKAVVCETENYSGLESEPIMFKITDDELASIYVISEAIRGKYTAFESFSLEGLIIGAKYISGREEVVSLEELSVSYHSGDSLLFGDRSVSIRFLDKVILYPVEVVKATYELSGVVFEDSFCEYRGEYITPIFDTELPVGLDGVPLRAEVVGGGKNAGEYVVELVFFSDSKNYIIPDSISRVMTVLQKETDIVWQNLSFVYDGTLKSPDAYFVDVHGKKVKLNVVGARSLAGEYEAEAIFSDGNYTAKNTKASFSVLRADYDMREAFWTSGSFVYNGISQSVTLSGLPEGVFVIGYSDNSAIEAGIYYAGVTLSYDTQNYNPPSLPVYRWEIFKADYDMSCAEFSDTETVYDGSIHYPLLSGKMPVGLDGSSPSYSFSHGTVNVSEGKTLVKISFFTESKNYNAPDDIYRFVRILPLEIEVDWENFESVYDGKPFVPDAKAEESEIEVLGGEINAGKYTAIAVALDSNYAVKNYECEFEILKAENYWSILPSAIDIYTSQSLSCLGAAAFGDTLYIYSRDMIEEIEIPKIAGVFYFRALSAGDENHLPIISEWISFEIIEVAAVDFFIKLTGNEFLTLERLEDEDFSAFVRNNDSSVVRIPFSEVNISYAEGDSLHISDTAVSFSYLDFFVTEEIRVIKRDYDLGAVYWEGLKSVYDGSKKEARILGLPEGIKLLGYIGNGQINAGIYVISPRIEYDEENYNEPILADVIMNVEKQKVIVPEIESAEYNADIIIPKIEDSDLYSFEIPHTIDAGEYTVVFKLNDSENYSFEGGLSKIEKRFTVSKAKLVIQISDIERYFFDKYSEPGYRVVSGNIFNTDLISPSYEIGDNEVFAVFEHPNYEIEVLSGRINDYRRFSPDDTRILIFILAIILFGTISTLFIVFNRKRIVSAYRSTLCENEGFVPTAPVIKSPEITEKEGDFLNEDEIPEREDERAVEGVEASENYDIRAHSDSSVSPASVIDAGYADSVITDSLAKDLIRKECEIKTSGSAKRIINVDTLSRSFCANDRVDINVLKNKHLIPYDTGYIKVLARGIIDKPLIVYANDFSLSAVKMIALSGGKSIKVNTSSEEGIMSIVKFRKRT